eukprot:13131363-Alexandrium_andersonii.AAC.1
MQKNTALGESMIRLVLLMQRQGLPEARHFGEQQIKPTSRTTPIRRSGTTAGAARRLKTRPGTART